MQKFSRNRCICGAFQGEFPVFVDFNTDAYLPYCNKCGLGGHTGEIDPYPIYWGKKFRKIHKEEVLKNAYFYDFEFYWENGTDWFWEGYEVDGWALAEVIDILREAGFP